MKARLVKRVPQLAAPCRMTTEQRKAFFYDLQQLPLEEQALRVRDELKRNVGITGTPEFIRWCVEFAGNLGDYDVIFEEETL